MRESAAVAVAACFAAHSKYQESKSIACYLPNQDEIDTQAIINTIWEHGKACYLPVLQEGKSLAFARFDKDDRLRENQYAIREPENQVRKMSPEKLDLVILPLIAFDRMGHRLGTGGGYYDRTFAFMHGGRNRRPALFGLAFSEQEAEMLPYDPWDVLMDGVITERGAIQVEKQPADVKS